MTYLLKWKYNSRPSMSNVSNTFYILRDQTLTTGNFGRNNYGLATPARDKQLATFEFF